MYTPDNEALGKGICPDCGGSIRDYFFENDKPWCKVCDVWFTKEGGIWIRNKDANKRYNELWTDMNTVSVGFPFKSGVFSERIDCKVKDGESFSVIWWWVCN